MLSPSGGSDAPGCLRRRGLSVGEPLVFRGVRAAARETGIPRDLLYSAIRDGRLRIIRSGRTALIPRAELQRWIEAEARRSP